MVIAILVTGGTGYIGSHICVELLNAGYKIIVIDNFSNSNPVALKRIRKLTGQDFKFYKLNILNKMSLNRVFLENKIDAVIHLAGVKAVNESIKTPLKYYSNNVKGTLNLCEVMDENNVRNIVFSSSATTYGTPGTVPINEDSYLSAKNPYGRSKLISEEIFRDLYESNPNWSIALLRYFNPIGAHESGEIGEDSKGIPNNLMPYITQVGVGKLRKLAIFGSDYPTVDGTGVRDYIHVVDLAIGHLKALEKVMISSGVEAYNLGTGKGYSVLEMIASFEMASGIKIPYKFADRRSGDIGEIYSDPTKAKEELNWVAEKGLEEMCKDAWRWQYNNPNGYKTKFIASDKSLNT
jgi:UDP-glucose 4-epimerase